MFLSQAIYVLGSLQLGIAGGVCAFVLGKDNPHPRLAAFGLLLPATLCIGLGVAFLRGMDSSRELNQALQALKRYLNRTLAPHAINLTKSLQWLGYLLIISGIGLLLLWGYVSLGLSQHHKDKLLKPGRGLSSSALYSSQAHGLKCYVEVPGITSGAQSEKILS
jgi:hypothetical protein